MTMRLLAAGAVCAAALAISGSAQARQTPPPGIGGPAPDMAPSDMSKAPEPADWIIMVAGFAIVGAKYRRLHRQT